MVPMLETTVIHQATNKRQYNTSQCILPFTALYPISQIFYVHSLPDWMFSLEVTCILLSALKIVQHFGLFIFTIPLVETLATNKLWDRKWGPLGSQLSNASGLENTGSLRSEGHHPTQNCSNQPETKPGTFGLNPTDVSSLWSWQSCGGKPSSRHP